MVTKDPRPPSERSRRDASSLGGSFFVNPLLKMFRSTTPQKMTIQKKTHLDWMRLFESFPAVASECPQLSRFAGKLVFYAVTPSVQPSCVMSSVWQQQALTSKQGPFGCFFFSPFSAGFSYSVRAQDTFFGVLCRVNVTTPMK